jgi:superfamily I DNA/RNA helicase
MEQWINFEPSLNQRLNLESLDEQQNKARNFSLKGHSLVRGIAGSGKSLVLRNRVEKLINEGYDDILVLCYNRFMNGWLNSKLEEKGLSLNVECKTFHSWAYQIGYDYHWDDDQKKREQIISLVENNAKHRYQAILIDEAQDFYDEWFKAMLNAVNPETNSIFFVYDNTQSVYGQLHRRKGEWTWKSLGFSIAGGSSQIFELNYRNTPEILELAWRFIVPYLERAGMTTGNRSKAQGDIRLIVKPIKNSSRSSSIKPVLVKSNMSASTIAQQIKLALNSHPESSIGVLLHPNEDKNFKQEISKCLWSLGIENHAPMNPKQRDHDVVNRPFVVIDSWNALKGVEFDAVIIAGVDQVKDLPDPDGDFQEKAGLYTAMTRARDHLIMLYQYETPVVNQIREILTSPDVLDNDSSLPGKVA